MEQSKEQILEVACKDSGLSWSDNLSQGDSQCNEYILSAMQTYADQQVKTAIGDRDKYLKTVGEMHDRIVELEADVKERDKIIRELEENKDDDSCENPGY